MHYRLLMGVSVFWLGLAMLVDGLTALLLPHQLLARMESADSATLLGLTTFAAIVLGMLVQPVAGLVSDRRGGDRRGPMLVGTVAALVGLSAMVLGDGVLSLIAGYLLAIVAANVAQAGQQALVPDRVPAAWRGRAAGAKGVLDVGGASVAFLVIAALLAAGEVTTAIVVLGGGLAATLVVALVLVPARPGSSTLARGRPAAPPSRAFVRVVLARFLFLLGIYAVGRFFVLFVADRLDLGADAAAGEAGVMLAVLALVTAGASVPAGWAADRLGRPALMLSGAVLAATGIGLLSVAASTASLFAFGGLMALGTALFGAGSWALLTDLAPPENAGRLMGLANLGTAGAAAAAGLIGPAIDAANLLASGLGFTMLLALAAAATLSGGLLSIALIQPLATAKE